MSESEGVIKYQLDFEISEAPLQDLTEIIVWRRLLFGLGLIGQDEQRYGGFGYGNLSIRSENNPDQFIISASQTGHLDELTAQHYTTVKHCDVGRNFVQASGPLPPSSEALTHSMIYRLSDSFQCVLHVHDRELWHFALDQGVAFTAAEVEYGTPAMAAEVLRLYRQGAFDTSCILAMAGHEDGLIFFGDSLNQAGQALVDLWVSAELKLEI